LKKYLKDYLWLALLAGLIIGLDQWTKYLVRANLSINETWSPWEWLAPYARIVHWKNTGAAFGMLQQFGGVFTVLSLLVSLAIIYFYPRVPRSDWPLRLALGMQMSGAMGNLIDRLAHGYVIDFVSLGTFPVFNVADASISMGVVALLLGVWIKDRHQQKNAPPAQGDASDKALDADFMTEKAAALPEDDSALQAEEPPAEDAAHE